MLCPGLWKGTAQPLYALLYVTVYLAFGMLFYTLSSEGFPLVDAAYFSMVTMSTVGYGDMGPVTPLGKVVTVCADPARPGRR